MINVGVSELKSYLGRYLSLVKNGEIISVTNHNKIIAEIRQPEYSQSEDAADKKQKIEVYLEKLKSENKLRKATRRHSEVETLKPTKKISAEYKWKDIYQKSREDIRICTYDKNMKETARKINISVLPIEN